MRPVTEPGAFASWIAPPRAGIDSKPGDFEYVKLQGWRAIGVTATAILNPTTIRLPLSASLSSLVYEMCL